MQTIKKNLTFSQIEKYGNKEKILVKMLKGKLNTLKAELVQYDESVEKGLLLVEFNKDIRLVREGYLNKDFDFIKPMKQKSHFNYSGDKFYEMSDLIDIFFDYFYLNYPLLSNLSQMSKLIHYKSGFPPYLFLDDILLNDNKLYKLYFEGGRLIVFSVLVVDNEEKQVKLFDYNVNKSLYDLAVQYDTLRFKIISTINLSFMLENSIVDFIDVLKDAQTLQAKIKYSVDIEKEKFKNLIKK